MNDNDNDKTEDWHLAFIFGEQESEDSEPVTKINAIESICYESFKNDYSLISEYHSSLQLVKSVQLNIQEFLESIVHYASEFLNREDMNEEKFDLISLNFSRQLLNILSMFRSLLDHSEFSISREFGKDSDQLKKWKNIQSKYYDEYFEYRLFYKLRNYCQHIGMPPLSISFTSSREEEGISFRLDIKRDELLKEKTVWNKQLIHDLNSADDKISIIDSLNIWSECFRGISKVLLDIKRDGAIDAANRVAGHRARLKLPTDIGRLCAVHIPHITEKPKNLNMSLSWLPENKAIEILKGNPFDKISQDA
ncbi:hypothetical protein [Thiothrix nivea]|uniref:Uncharacterized protein n=1 Tax=Thiothrix nivea (strain ATCC 35100 / DSM 5205 / JP2) TaxID=870187 RepID=A0A656HNR8_THINJ|nr:hypothetical protein [Thiothrix nivea]EIJ36999.1 hypothetical protein Thini_4531 [Thiothrix nivea DSM 5205]